MKLKKIIAMLLLAGMLTTSLAACNPSGNPDESGKESGDASGSVSSSGVLIDDSPITTIESIKLMGADISEYVIFAKSADDTAAKVIKEYVKALADVELSIVTEGEYEKAFVLGNAGTAEFASVADGLSSDEYIIKSVGTKIYLGTVGNENYYEDGPAVHKFFEDILGYDFETNKLSKKTVDVSSIDERAKIDDYLLKVADDAFLADIDAKAEELKQTILASATTVEYTGTAYYVSSTTGNDKNDGLTPETAWRSVQHVSFEINGLLQPGDAVFFKRGDVFRCDALNTVAGVTYSAYGEGAKPVINGSPKDAVVSGKWTEVAPNVWRYNTKFSKDVGTIIFNNGEKASVKVVPNFDAATRGETIINNWTGEEFSYKTMGDGPDLSMYVAYSRKLNEYVDTDWGYLYLVCKEGDPKEVFDSIEFCGVNGGYDFNLIRLQNDVVIDNLCVSYTGGHGISAHKGQGENVRIQYCEISYIGGCLEIACDDNGPDKFKSTRFGNGIQFWASADNTVVDHCYIHDCFDAGITHQGSNSGGDETFNDCVYSNNLLERSLYNVEFFGGGVAENFKIINNIMRYAGYGFGGDRDKTEADANNSGSYNISWSCRDADKNELYVSGNIFQYAERFLVRNTVDENTIPTYENNIFIGYEGCKLGTVANTTEGKHGGYAYLTYSGIDSAEWRGNSFYMVKNK